MFSLSALHSQQFHFYSGFCSSLYLTLSDIFSYSWESVYTIKSQPKMQILQVQP